VTSGVPILQALNITRETAGNTVIANAISRVHDSVKEGESIVQPLDASGAFPPMVISMVDVGEETGQLPEMLLKIAEVYDDEVGQLGRRPHLNARADYDRHAGRYRGNDRYRVVHAADQHYRGPTGAELKKCAQDLETGANWARDVGSVASAAQGASRSWRSWLR
jgi:hypothetical protein